MNKTDNNRLRTKANNIISEMVAQKRNEQIRENKVFSYRIKRESKGKEIQIEKFNFAE